MNINVFREIKSRKTDKIRQCYWKIFFLSTYPSRSAASTGKIIPWVIAKNAIKWLMLLNSICRKIRRCLITTRVSRSIATDIVKFYRGTTSNTFTFWNEKKYEDEVVTMKWLWNTQYLNYIWKWFRQATLS